jgi:hypothetical protein
VPSALLHRDRREAARQAAFLVLSDLEDLEPVGKAIDESARAEDAAHFRGKPLV